MKSLTIQVGDDFPEKGDLHAFSLAVGRGAVVVLLVAPIDVMSDEESRELWSAQSRELRAFADGMDRKLAKERAEEAGGG